MRFGRPAELIVGSVQLGLAYGAANRTGKPDRQAALRLVRRAADAGVAGFDTARAYGDSEDRLKDRRIPTITELSPLAELAPEASHDTIIAAVDNSIAASLAALRREKLDCLLLHRAVQLTASDGVVWKRLEHHLATGTVGSILQRGPSARSACPSNPRQRRLHLWPIPVSGTFSSPSTCSIGAGPKAA